MGEAAACILKYALLLECMMSCMYSMTVVLWYVWMVYWVYEDTYVWSNGRLSVCVDDQMMLQLIVKKNRGSNYQTTVPPAPLLGDHYATSFFLLFAFVFSLVGE